MSAGNSWSGSGDRLYTGLIAAQGSCTALCSQGAALCVMRTDLPSPASVCQQLYQIQQVTMPAGQDITQPMFIQSTNQSSDGQATQVTGD